MGLRSLRLHLCFDPSARRMGNTVVVAYPDGTLGHYHCHAQSQKNAAAGGPGGGGFVNSSGGGGSVGGIWSYVA